MINEIDTIKHIMRFFAYKHLPEHLQKVSAPFCELASNLYDELPDNPQKLYCLHSLMDAKDRAVRAVLAK